MMECAWCERDMHGFVQYITVVEINHAPTHEVEEYNLCSSQCLKRWAE
jgi:hypothetical protein